MKFYKLYMVMLAVALIGFSCTDDFDELNTDPLALTADKVDASLIGLAFAQTQYRSMYGGGGYQIAQNLFADMWCQYFAVTHPNFPSDRYTQVGRWSNSAWTTFYGQAAPNVKFTEDFTAENGLTVLNAVAKVWKVQAFHRITDFWGPIPYSQFGNGELSVPYDQQEDIYRSFFVTLDEALSVLNANTGASAFGSNDQIYSGDVNGWIKFANSLRLRLAMRVRYADPGLAKAEAEKAVAAGVITMNEENAEVITTANSFHPLNQITAWGEFRMSTLMESILKGYDDPRISAYFAPALDGDSDGDGNPYEGLRNGQSQVQLTDSKNRNHSDLADYFRPVNSPNNPPIKVLRAAEVYLLRAEGALLGWNMGGTAKELYEQGIRMSILEWGAAEEDAIAAYVSSPNVPVDASPESPAVSDIPVAFDESGSEERKLEQIITQKWLAVYPDGFEAFAELRRTKYPKQYSRLNSENLDVGVDEIISKMKYESSEYDNNRAAVEAAVASPENGGQDKNSTKVWWDKK
ncbi:MAG: SusD/RagB family nutrient-binding outer membrane lipoprotein [Saprospiraceae bacterium]|nr:SusD/RagB family nutrient-binding outer membrane lipoprotein [Saprospiraceae bacterium]